jgi:radical SAM family uncharacterized protein/radical SAM-linked protein
LKPGRVSRPSRYINNEINSVYRKSFIRVALAFPDIYDVGMSHIGLRILYEIINNIPYASAERVFSPWPDMESELRRLGLPLSSLESNSPLRDFDVIGFSLQYELSYTTVLNMLDLSGIPLRSELRRERDPVIIAGGPCTVNPGPMAPFIDAFLIGDGEEAILEIIDTIYRVKKDGSGRRREALQELSRIEGLYVPLVHGNEQPIKRRYIEDLDAAPYPLSPVVPFTPIVHDRITIEVARGCSKGCRFCQAGMVYRPHRERSPERILEIAEKSLKNTGYEEVSFSSLSTGDYSALILLMKETNRRFSKKVVSISLPSLRVASVNKDILREIKVVRKTGFTIAPEAATERLRAIINKDFNDEDYERALHALFSEGWQNLKLYFMVGLPGERHEDIEAIPEMALKAIKISKRYSRRFVNISVTVSPFVPKPHTPFQWIGQEPIKKIKEKMDYLREILRKKGINYKGHDPDMSLLEAIFSRGDERLSDLIEEAWKRGCRLDAWTEVFDFNKWVEAAESLGINLNEYAERGFASGSRLPWDNIDTGIKKEFLLRELDRAYSHEITPDCKDKCYGCGLRCPSVISATERRCNSATDSTATERQSDSATDSRSTELALRLQFEKTGKMRYLSHRELMTAIIRALRRADIPLLYSQGFHPSPRVSFGPPLSVGVAGLREYLDLEIEAAGWVADLKGILNATLPEGIRILRLAFIPKDTPSLDSFIKRYEYEIIISNGLPLKGMREFMQRDSCIVERKTGDTVRLIDLRRMVESLHIIDKDRVTLRLIDQEDKVRLAEVIRAIFGIDDIDEIEITRTGLYGWDPERGEWIDPILFGKDIEVR